MGFVHNALFVNIVFPGTTLSRRQVGGQDSVPRITFIKFTRRAMLFVGMADSGELLSALSTLPAVLQDFLRI